MDMIKIHCCSIVWNKLNQKKKVSISHIEIKVDFLIQLFEERSPHMSEQEPGAVT